MKTITTREVWGAVPPKSEGEEPLKTPVKMLLMMDTQSAECNTRDDCLLAVKELQRVYMEEKGYDDIPWNFLIGGDGGIYEGRGWKNKSFKLDLTNPIQKKYDGTSLDIAYIGDFKSKAPAPAVSDVAYDLIQLGTDSNYINRQQFDIENLTMHKVLLEV